MHDVGHGYMEAQIMAHMSRRRNQSGADRENSFPKTLVCEEVGKVLYNSAAAPHAPTFAILSYHLPSQLLRFPIRIDTRILLHSQTRSEKMAPMKGAAKPRKEATEASRDEEWVSPKMGEADGCRLPDRVTAGWRPANGEPFPTPHTDEAVVFEDYFW